MSTCPRRERAGRKAGFIGAFVLSTLPALAHANELAPEGVAPAESAARPPPAKGVTAALGVGATTGTFFELPYRAVLLDGGVRLERRYVRWVADAELEIGRTERGLSLYRGAVTGGVENAGRLRIGAGPRVSYTMVLRATRDSPFVPALFGDIGGFGLGAHAWLALDIVRADELTVVLAGRGSADVYDGGYALRGAALLEVGF